VAHARSGGFALASRGRARAFHDYTVRMSTAEPHAVIEPCGGPGRRGVFLGDLVRIESDAEGLVAERRAPRAAFVWLRPGVTLDDAGPWSEEGETWQRLRVRFPPGVPTHSPEQVFHLDAAGLVRRHDYTAEVFGSWATAAHYCRGHRGFDGLVFPTRRQVLPRARAGRRRPFPTLVWIEIDALAVVR
jgi:hypothetical protein